jgi:hypothetical protein
MYPSFGVQRLPNGRWLVRAPTGDPVGPRIDIAAVVSSEPSSLPTAGKPARRDNGK